MIASEGFGSFDDRYGVVADDNRKEYRSGDYDKSGLVYASCRVVFTPLFGLLNQEELRTASEVLPYPDRARTNKFWR